MIAAASLSGAFQQKARPNVLNDDEQDQLREEQDPARRIVLYLVFAQARLNLFVNFRAQSKDPQYDNGAYMDGLLSDYIAITDEMKDWIQDQYDRKGDMRSGLHALLERGPQQLQQLRDVQQRPDPLAPDYAGSLKDAIADFTDTLDGATKALGDQEKKFGELKRAEKQNAQDAKARAKEERKNQKEEKKVRKKEHKPKTAPDEDE
jgi:hypothetical protein